MILNKTVIMDVAYKEIKQQSILIQQNMNLDISDIEAILYRLLADIGQEKSQYYSGQIFELTQRLQGEVKEEAHDDTNNKS